MKERQATFYGSSGQATCNTAIYYVVGFTALRLISAVVNNGDL